MKNDHELKGSRKYILITNDNACVREVCYARFPFLFESVFGTRFNESRISFRIIYLTVKQINPLNENV